MPTQVASTPAAPPEPIMRLAAEASRRAPDEAARFLADHPPADLAAALAQINPLLAQQILRALPETVREAAFAAAPVETADQWRRNREYPDQTVGRLMDPPIAVFRPSMTIAETTEALRLLTRRAFITYGWVADADNRLLGVVVMRELLLGAPGQTLEEIMLKNPFSLRPETPLTEAMKQVLNKHFPVYPVCDAEGRLVGILRGQHLFEAQAIEISAQAGRMVGVENEERLTTPFLRSFKLRHPWLQINLLTAFLAAAVVGAFENTLDQLVILAVFLPVLAGQSGNTGCQALAVALRGITLGDLKPGRERNLIFKEALLGLLNGTFVGLSAGAGMAVYATMQKQPSPFALGGIVFAAMIASCIVSGISGAVIPLILKRLGADPATASSIFVTTATDIASMGFFLGLATLLLLR